MEDSVVDIAYALEAFRYLLDYVPVTLALAIGSMFLGSLLGLAVMFVRWRNVPVLGKIGTWYVVVGRALPTLIILYIVFFAFPVFLLYMNDGQVSERFNAIPPFLFALAGLTLHSGAYLAEAFRTAVQSVDKGQMEAALACGMTWSQGFRRIVLPQAAVLAVPLMGNQFLSLIKNTSIAFMITVLELFGAANYLSSISERYIEIYLALAALYWLVSMFFETLFRKLEIRLAVYKGSGE